MNDPNVGGYLLWRFPEHIKIAMDMKVPFVFHDIDMFVATGFYADEMILARVLREHRPTYVIVPLDLTEVAERLRDRAPTYRLVNFDDTSALYADSEQRPQLRVLTRIDPFRYLGSTVPTLAGDEEHAMLSELEHVLSFHPTAVGPNQLRAIIANRDGRWEEAERSARIVVEHGKSMAIGWLLLGDALMGQGRSEEAIAAYRIGLSLAGDEAFRRLASRSLGFAHSSRNEKQHAYRYLREGIGLFDPQATSEQQETLADAAFAAGHYAIGRQLIEFALVKTDIEDDQRRLHLEGRLAALRGLEPVD